MKPRRQSRLPATKVSAQLSAVYAEIGATDRNRIEAVVGLLDAEHRAGLSECLKGCFPGKGEPGALAAFKALRGRFNGAAETAGESLRLVVDTRKKTPPIGRFCWFEAKDTTEQEIIQFSEEGTRDVTETLGKTLVRSTGLLTNWRKLLAGPSPARIFVSYARENRTEAAELLDQVKTAWKAALPAGQRMLDPEWIWVDWDLKGGQRWRDEIAACMDRANLGLFLVSVESLASDFIVETELPHFLKHSKPIIPVRFGALRDPSAPRLAPLRERQFVELSGGRPTAKLSYLDVRKDKVRRGQFAHAVLEGIAAAIAEWHGLSPQRGPAAKAPDAPTAKLPDDASLRAFVEYAADLEHADEDERYIRGHARMVSLGELNQIDLSQALPEGKVGQALDQLQRWLEDPSGSRFFAVLGELGIGKTTTLQCFTRQLLLARTKKPSLPLPIFVDLRLYHHDDTRRQVPTLEELLSEVIRHHWKGGANSPLTAGEIVEAVRSGSAIIIFDGLDEKLVHYTREQSAQFIRELWRILPPPPKPDPEGAGQRPRGKASGESLPGKPGGRMVLSCRSHYFKDVISQNAMLLGEYRDGPDAKDYEVSIILPFNDEQVRAYLRMALGNEGRADDAIAFFKKVHNLEELSRRPFLLSQIVPQLAQLEARRLRGEVILGITIYEDLVARWLARDSGKNQFTDAHKLELMEQLAADMAVAGARSWPWDKVEKWLGRFLAARPDVAVFYRNHSPEVLHQDFRTATFVLRPDDSRSDFRFAHSSLGEFFHARRLVRALDEETPDAWQIRLPSVETLDFAGQFLALDPQPERIRALERLLTDGGRGAVLAFRLWLTSVERGYPQPGPVIADLRRAPIEGWRIAGGATDRPLVLRGARLENACLRGARLENVDLSGATLDGADAGVARFQDCRLEDTQFGRADLSGAVFRDCLGARLAGSEAIWQSVRWIRGDLTDALLPSDFGTAAAVARAQTNGVILSRPTDLPARLEAVIIQGRSGSVWACAWSPDGQSLLSGSLDGSFRLWDAASGQCLQTLTGHSGRVRACVWSRDGVTLLSASDDRTLRLWDAASGRCDRILKGHSDSVRACNWSPDGRSVLSASSDRTLRLWDAASGQCLRVLEGHSEQVRSCTWSPDGRFLLSTSSDRTLRLWDAVSGECLRTLEGHSNWVRGCSWSPDGRLLLSASEDRTLRLWDAVSGRCLRILDGHSDRVRACAWSPDGRSLLSASDDGTLRIWDALSGLAVRRLEGHVGRVHTCAWSPNGASLLSASSDGSLRIWDAASGQCLRTLPAQSASAKACIWSPSRCLLLSISTNRTVRLWKSASGQCLRTLEAHSDRVWACDWSPHGDEILSASMAGTLRVWDTASGQCLRTLGSHSTCIRACSWSPDGRLVLSASDDRTLRTWDAASGEVLRTFEGHSASVWACAWSPDGRSLLSASLDRTLRLWDVASGRCLRTLQGHSGAVLGCVWSPDGRWLLSASNDRTLYLWDATSGKRLHTLAGHSDSVRACAWSPNSASLLSASDDRTLRLWDRASGQCLQTLDGHTASVIACAWSPDGCSLLSASNDGTLRLWDAASRQCSRILAELPGGETASLTPDRIHTASPGAWEHLAWRYQTPTGPRLLPAEFFYDLPAA